MRRREFMQTTGLGLGALGLGGLSGLSGAQAAVSANSGKKPNIVFFLIDDQRNDTIGCAGHPFVKTPTVDSLAKNGVRFTNMFVTTSICAASRASIFTGLHECSHNYTFGKPPIKKEFVRDSYPSLLKQAGYSTGFVGKFGVILDDQESMVEEMFDYFKPAGRNAPFFRRTARREPPSFRGDQG